MKFEPLISGVRVTEFQIECPINRQIVTLQECMEKFHRQETMDYILDNYRFSLCEDGEWRAVLTFDDRYKIAVLESYPQYEKELIEYFGEDWLKYYVRFGH